MSQLEDGNTFIQWLSSRRSIRHYEKRVVPTTIIRQLLQAAIWAPSAHNRQPWRFTILIEDEERERLARGMAERLREDLAADGLPEALITTDTNRSIRRLTGAPVVILLSLSLEDMDKYPDTRRSQSEWQMAVQSTAMAGQNLLLAAHALGLGACWMCAPLFCPETVQQLLKLPASWLPQGLITVGYPAEHKEKSRRPIEEVTLNWEILSEHLDS